LSIFVALLIASRVALPFALERYVNRVLDRSDGYAGSVGDIDVSLVRGAYTIEDVRLEDASGDVPVPIFEADALRLSIEWRALLHGEIVSEVELDGPNVNLVMGPTEEKTQTPADAHWTARLEDLVPFSINRFEAHDGRVRFRNLHSEPPVDIGFSDVSVLAENLTNVRDRSQEYPATSHATGRAFETGELEIDLSMNPFAEQTHFTMDLSIENADIVSLNEFLRAYLKLDAQQGQLSVYSEITAEKGRFEGYITPLIRDLEILELKEVDDQSPIATLWEGASSWIAEIFENQPRDQQAARIPISGELEDPDYGLWATLESVFRNAFIQALEPRVES